MSAKKTDGAVRGRSEADRAFAAEGCSSPRPWANAAGETYGRHSHAHHKVLFCLFGSIVFRTDEGDVELRPGDRLDLEPGTEHSATVGPDGVECVEAFR